MNNKELKSYSLDEITDKYIGKIGTPKRDAFENELRLDLIGEAIKQARKERNFQRADEIRAELLEKGIVLEDTREGVKWKRA